MEVLGDVTAFMGDVCSLCWVTHLRLESRIAFFHTGKGSREGQALEKQEAEGNSCRLPYV